ncbi:hypothetical protein [Paenibacillus sp.]|uniref:hypothetical protein n=1 Tax=Paenibacillus sp. TaxID=58172 RepID=UPI002D5A95DB|nr:hypothetical protein [Paenibacillus sp.]HZG85852.1 hypothetical protein [Paenibacillus sp.]
MEEQLLAEMKAFVAELERKEAAAVYAVPEEAFKAIRRAKTLEKFLHDIFAQAGGSGGIRLLPYIRREFGIDAEAIERFDRWAPYAKDRFEEALHEAVDRADIRAGNQGVFFAGTPSKKEAEEALRLLRDVAHAAIEIQFAAGRASPERYVAILDAQLRFYALPSTYQAGTEADYRSLIAADRLAAFAGGDETAAQALRHYARAWYQESGHAFLESREGYFDYTDVPKYLYALTGEQVARLRGDYVRYAEEQFRLLRTKPDLARGRALIAMLEQALRWQPL